MTTNTVFTNCHANEQSGYLLQHAHKHGDLKATLGDTGHTEINMITKVYAHILDDDRNNNAQKFEAEFYAQPDLHDAKSLESGKSELDLNGLIAQLQQSPELTATLTQLIHAQGVKV